MVQITSFRVGCGDMTLITTEGGKNILIDCRIRSGADDPNHEYPDVASQLRERLNKDADGRYYVDAMVLSHPDEDHCQGLTNHFHLGPISDFPKGSDKIVIREMWSSPIVFRRGSKYHVLCSDAKAWAKEARRRVNFFKAYRYLKDNERIVIIGEDQDGKTDDIMAIVKKAGENITYINAIYESNFNVRVIAPMPATSDEEEELLTKNDSSIIMRYKLGKGYDANACRFLTGGDAEVAIWEKVWNLNKDNKEVLEYDVLLSPHHCSWHSLSYDSWSKLGEDVSVSEDARKALGQARSGAKIIASSKPITDDDADPPCIRAKREYKDILKDKGSLAEFICLGDAGPDPLELEISSGGAKRKAVGSKVAAGAAATVGGSLVGTSAFGHG